MQLVGTDSRIVENISKEEIFNKWADINNWHTFNDDIDYAKLDGEFKEGNFFTLGLKGGQKVKIQLIKIEKDKSFTDLTKFPLAKMYGIHEITEKNGKIEIKASIKIEGILSFLWKKIVAQEVADKLGEDMDRLIRLIENEKRK
ncbi:MAG: hypothetical protein ACNI25_08610 [Halarcobacter sp.]